MIDNFAEKAADWDSPQKIKMTEKYVSELLKLITLHKNQKALELGAGTGLVGFKLLPKINSVVFVDTSAAMLEILKRKIKPDDQVEVLHGDVLLYDKKDIDLVVSNMAFHHIINIKDVLKHLYKITSDHAKIVISDLVSEDGSFHNFEEVPHKGFEIEDLSAQFEDEGFKNIKSYVYTTLKREKSDGKMHYYDQFILLAEK
ncbi:class I SAM-dependent methyltransferase [Saccharicrinis sp. FJH62]|uniref:class I SAM-dependent methyltransferase n=1 Tax=Saccharicrinis sp. FJH62 TaxID=3344657 RepID=UPI0035D46952